MAARRRKAKSGRRRKKSGISIINTAETLVLANVATQTLFNTDLKTFFMGTTGNFSDAQGLRALSLKELFQTNQASQTVRGMGGSTRTITYTTGGVIMDNLKANAATGIAGMILVPLAFKLGKKVGRPVITRTNRLLNQSGVGSTVKL